MLLTALAAVACQPSGPSPTPVAIPGSEIVSGIVISADGPDASRVDRFSLRENDGTVHTFTVGVLDVSNGGLPAPHLREHLVSGDPITVWYSTSDGGLVALRYEDAAE